VSRTIPAAVAFTALLFVALSCVSGARAQSTSAEGSASAPSAPGAPGSQANPDAGTDAGPATGGREIEFWSGGGPSIHGGIQGLGVWNTGFRYGWILTAPHGPGFLRGRFEYAVDAVPIFWVIQPGGTAYGVVLVPMALKWDLATRGRVVPYMDIDGGVLFTNRLTPPGISTINFTPSAALGFYLLRHKYNWSAEFRFLHISDASLTKLNPGINTLEVRLGFGLFTHPK